MISFKELLLQKQRLQSMFIKNRKFREMITVTPVGAWYLHRN